MQDLQQCGEWRYRLEADGSATILQWDGDIYSSSGVCVAVPEKVDGHRVAALEGDVFGEERIVGLVDDGWLPPVSVESAPDAPARLWSAQHASDYLYWECTEGVGNCCCYHLLSDGSACLDAWWSNEATLVLPDTLDGHPVTRLGDGAVSFVESSSIVVPEGVVSIGDSCFRRCETTRINLPATLRELGKEAFRDCYCLRELLIPEGVETVSYALLKGCDDLGRLRLPASVRVLGSFALSDCGSLRELALPAGLTSIESFAFSMTGLHGLVLPASVCSIDEHAFAWCRAQVLAPEGTYAQQWLDEHPDRSSPL